MNSVGSISEYWDSVKLYLHSVFSAAKDTRTEFVCKKVPASWWIKALLKPFLSTIFYLGRRPIYLLFFTIRAFDPLILPIKFRAGQCYSISMVKRNSSAFTSIQPYHFLGISGMLAHCSVTINKASACSSTDTADDFFFLLLLLLFFFSELDQNHRL